MEGEGANSGRSRRESAPEVGYDTVRPVRSLYETVREVILRPREFFAGLSPDYDLGPDHPIWFAVVLGLLVSPLLLVTEAFDPVLRADGGPGALEVLQRVSESAGLLAAVGLTLLFWLLTPVFTVVGLFISAALVHILIWLLVPDRGDYYTTLKVAAYASAIGVLTWIPVLGYLATLYGYYINYWGWRGMHNATHGRALAVALIQAVVGLGFATSSLWS